VLNKECIRKITIKKWPTEKLQGRIMSDLKGNKKLKELLRSGEGRGEGKDISIFSAMFSFAMFNSKAVVLTFS
jgi:hypothetical protein